MDPTLPTDSPLFTDVETRQILQTFERLFGGWIAPGETWTLSGALDGDDLELRLRGEQKDPPLVSLLEFGCTLEPERGFTVLEARSALVEALFALVDTWFRGERLPPPPLDWQRYQHEDRAFYHRGRVEREDLKAMADRLLAEAGFDPDA
jgi:hypothetical protein